MATLEKILKGSLDLDPITFTFNENSNYGQNFCLRFKCKTLLGAVNKKIVFKGLLTSACNVLPYYLK